MFKFKKILGIGLVVLTVSALSTTALAASAYSSPAEAVAGLTGRTLDSVVEERTATGNSYGMIADDAGVLDGFKAEALAIKKAALDEKVAAGDMTQEEADDIMAALEANQATCDGSGSSGVGKSFGAGFGSNSAGGRGNGGGLGQGGGKQYKGQNGQGTGTGVCLQDSIAE